MSLRISLVLVIILAYISIGVTCYFTQQNESTYDLEDPPFFYNVDPDALSRIIVELDSQKQSWRYNSDFEKWFFEDPPNIPASMFRWGGVTQLLGGPKTQRVIKSEIDNLSKYGLDNPSMIITLELTDKSNIRLILGSLTPDKNSHYSMIDGYPQLVLIDSSWGNIFERLAYDPPYPDWYYKMNPDEAKEILFFDSNDVVLGYVFNKKENFWDICVIPVATDPCTGIEKANQQTIENFLINFSKPIINGVEVLGVNRDEIFSDYEADRNAPYISIRIEKNKSSGVTEVTRNSITVGGITPDKKSRFSVINETSDIVLIDKLWGDKLLDYFKN